MEQQIKVAVEVAVVILMIQEHNMEVMVVLV
jgi:hypothetical protein